MGSESSGKDRPKPNGLGIVLSGGGSRGLAHAGVLKALRENGIEPHYVSGTSSGAIVGALHAADYTAEEILRFFTVANPFRLSKIALGKPGFIDPEKTIADFRKYLPEDSFEALSLRLFIAATDIVRARLRIFSSGPLIRPILASSSFPGVFTPTAVDGRLYVDGGALDNFPVEPLIGLCDVILGVYASPLHDVREKDLKSSFAISQRALEIGMYHDANRKFHLADFVLCPEELGRFGTFDTRHHAEILEVGYAATMKRMDEIRRIVERGKAS